MPMVWSYFAFSKYCISVSMVWASWSSWIFSITQTASPAAATTTTTTSAGLCDSCSLSTLISNVRASVHSVQKVCSWQTFCTLFLEVYTWCTLFVEPKKLCANFFWAATNFIHTFPGHDRTSCTLFKAVFLNLCVLANQQARIHCPGEPSLVRARTSILCQLSLSSCAEVSWEGDCQFSAWLPSRLVSATIKWTAQTTDSRSHQEAFAPFV